MHTIIFLIAHIIMFYSTFALRTFYTEIAKTYNLDVGITLIILMILKFI